jgi:GxxExxY protein
MEILTPTQKLIHSLAQRVFECVGPGHNEQIYQKALMYELNIQGFNVDMEYHLDVVYIDTLGNKHNLVSERIDLFIHKNREKKLEKNIIIELKAVAKNMSNIELTQVNKYLKELDKQNIEIDYGILINFPQPSTKSCNDKVEFIVV